MMLQAEISNKKNNRYIDTIQKVLIDGYDSDQKYYHGRTSRDAPEIDNEVLIASQNINNKLIGAFVNVHITDVSEYELYGKFDVNL